MEKTAFSVQHAYIHNNNEEAGMSGLGQDSLNSCLYALRSKILKTRHKHGSWERTDFMFLIARAIREIVIWAFPSFVTS